MWYLSRPCSIPVGSALNSFYDDYSGFVSWIEQPDKPELDFPFWRPWRGRQHIGNVLRGFGLYLSLMQNAFHRYDVLFHFTCWAYEPILKKKTPLILIKLSAKSKCRTRAPVVFNPYEIINPTKLASTPFVTRAVQANIEAMKINEFPTNSARRHAFKKIMSQYSKWHVPNRIANHRFTEIEGR